MLPFKGFNFDDARTRHGHQKGCIGPVVDVGQVQHGDATQRIGGGIFRHLVQSLRSVNTGREGHTREQALGVFIMWPIKHFPIQCSPSCPRHTRTNQLPNATTMTTTKVWPLAFGRKTTKPFGASAKPCKRARSGSTPIRPSPSAPPLAASK